MTHTSQRALATISVEVPHKNVPLSAFQREQILHHLRSGRDLPDLTIRGTTHPFLARPRGEEISRRGGMAFYFSVQVAEEDVQKTPQIIEGAARGWVVKLLQAVYPHLSPRPRDMSAHFITL